MKTLTDDQLAVAIPIAFKELFPDAMKHNVKEKKAKCLGLEFVKVCSKCKGQWYVDDWPERENCKHITPIAIDWNVAMMVARHCESVRFKSHDSKGMWWGTACEQVFIEANRKRAMRTEIFWRDYAEPQHYLRAALLAKGAE